MATESGLPQDIFLQGSNELPDSLSRPSVEG